MAVTKLTTEGSGIKLVSGIRASVGRKKDKININPLAPSIEDKKTCEAIGGKWNDKYDVCVLVEGEDGGWTAPIKGMYVWYSVTDLAEATGDEELEGKYIAEVMACLVADSAFYPTFAGGCRPILEMPIEYGGGIDVWENKDEAVKEAKEEMLRIARDIKEGDAEDWGLEYCSPKGRRTTPDDPNAIVADECSFVAEIMKKARGIKELREFIKEDLD